MSDGGSPRGELVDLNASLRRVMQQVRVTRAPEQTLRQAADALGRVEQLLAPHAHPGPFGQLSLTGEVSPGGAFDDPTRLFPYSPVIGALNPLAPPIPFDVADGVVRGEVAFGPLYTGPPGAVHGGVIALVFDELLSAVALVNRLAGFTGTLSVRYRARTPLQQPIRMEGRVRASEGRKTWAVGEMRWGDTLTAEAEGVFIRAWAGG